MENLSKNPIFESTEDQELYMHLMDTLPVPIFCRKTNGEVKMANRAFCRMFNIEKEQLIGKLLHEILEAQQTEVLTRRDREVIENLSDQAYECTLRLTDGTRLEVIINKAAMRLKNNQISGIICSIFDITQRRKTEKKLVQAQEERRIASLLLQKIRAGIVIVDRELSIIDSNAGFAQLAGDEAEELFETIPGLKGANLERILPGVITEMFQSIILSGEARIDRDLKFKNKLISVSVMTLVEHQIAGAIIRDLSAPKLERAEIIERARQVNRKNMKTVQQIAHLLGENAAQTEELLNSIIESQAYPDESTPSNQ
jgi:PAS domain S-box-containing protein